MYHRWEIMFKLHLAYTLIGTFLYAPLTALLSQALFAFSAPKSVLSDFEIADYLLSPFGALSALVLFAATTTSLLFEQVSMQAALLDTASRDMISLLFFALRRTKALLLFSLSLGLRIVLISAPFSLVLFWFVASAFDYDINYYLHAWPGDFVVKLLFMLSLITAWAFVLGRKLIDWSLALPIMVFRHFSVHQSFEHSARFVAPFRIAILKAFVMWGGCLVVGSLLLFGLLGYVASLTLSLFYDNIPLFGVAVYCWVALFGVAGFVLALCGAMRFAAITVHFGKRTGALSSLPSINLSKTVLLSKPIRYIFILAALLLSGGALYQNARLLFWREQPLHMPEIVAHRGASLEAPENTLAAFDAAIKSGADWIELDVQASSDGAVVVAHDYDLMRVGNKALPVTTTPLSTLKQVDVGSWFDPRFHAERLPTLEAVLRYVGTKSGLMIELKYYGDDPRLIDATLKTISKYPKVTIALISLKAPVVASIKDRAPSLQTGLLLNKSVGKLAAIPADFVAVNILTTDTAWIRTAHHAGKRVYVWTVDDPAAIYKAMWMGADGIITNDPALARRVSESALNLEPFEQMALFVSLLLNVD